MSHDLDKDIYVPPMLYFQKPDIGIYGNRGASGEDTTNDHPLQVVFASGGKNKLKRIVFVSFIIILTL
jgi:hypothetical protein